MMPFLALSARCRRARARVASRATWTWAWQAVERVTEYLAALPPEDVVSVAAPTIAACDALLKLAHSADNPQGTVCHTASPTLD